MKGFLAPWTLSVVLTGCVLAPPQARRMTEPHELVFVPSRGPYDLYSDVANAEGVIVSRGKNRRLLDATLACVPMAAEFEARARTNHRSGGLLVWGGALAAMAGALTPMILDATGNGSTEAYVVGLSSAAAGVSLAIFGAHRLTVGDRRRLDAVNAYNDQVLDRPGCRGAGLPMPQGSAQTWSDFGSSAPPVSARETWFSSTE